MNTDAERCEIFSQPAAARILHVADDRQAVGLVPFLAGSSVAQRPDTTAIAMDMREPHRKTLRTHVPDAVATVVFDKCHVMPHGNSAVETVRKRAHRALAADGPSPLTRTTCAWLRNPVSLSATAGRAFVTLRTSTLQTARARAMKERLRHLWAYTYLGAPRASFRRWCGWAMRPRLAPMTGVARMRRAHLDNILPPRHTRWRTSFTAGGWTSSRLPAERTHYQHAEALRADDWRSASP